jgi:hypothetical protein
MLRLIMIYSVAHLLAGIDTLLGRSAAWVPSGAKKHRNPTPLIPQAEQLPLDAPVAPARVWPR